jgi:large subunit ribosomal protein L4
MKLDLYNLTNEKIGEVEVSDEVFAAEVRPHLFHEVVKMQLANRRRVTHKGKTRSEVSGGGKKPFKQKGTGHARQGTSRSPHMVGGGWAFAKRNRDYSYSLNKKKCRAALRSVISMVVGAGKVKVVDNFDVAEIKTKAVAQTLNTLQMDRALVVDCKDGVREYTTLNNENLRLSVRNLTNYKYLRPEGVNVYDVLHYGGVVVTRAGLEKLEARLKG